MTKIGDRLRSLRVENRYFQKQIAEMCDVTQATIGRYETGVVTPPLDKLLWYADFFNVSLDYIFGRTDNPAGCLFEATPKTTVDEKSLRDFLEMCFEPGTNANIKLKEALLKAMMKGKK